MTYRAIENRDMAGPTGEAGTLCSSSPCRDPLRVNDGEKVNAGNVAAFLSPSFTGRG